jgi:formate hydrogenlyase subunit 6/NADH:ubiquinone oxidoreductase subunit I
MLKNDCNYDYLELAYPLPNERDGPMNIKIMTKEKLNEFVKNLIRNGNVVGVKEKDGKYAFGQLKNPEEMVWDYDVTLLPPKKYIMPQWETLIKFKVKAKVEVEAVMDSPSLTIIGVHPYDLKAINQLDRLFEENHPDGNYLKKRSATTIIALSPKKASKWSFWSSMNAAHVMTGFDLFLTDLGGRFAVETGTSRGEELLEKYAQCEKAAPKDTQDLEKIRLSLSNMCQPDRTVNIPPSKLPALLESRKNSEIWEQKAEKCYSCGSCNLICPTCYCFDVRESLDLNLNEGARYRVWDGCLLEDFAKIGSGENFREERKERYMHRFYRKWEYLEKKLNEPACVGCGRCSSVCLPDIADPVKVFNAL